MSKPQDDRRLGLAWAFASAVTSALFVIPWKLANEAGDPTDSVLLLLVFAALTNSVLVAWRSFGVGRAKFQITRMDAIVGALLAAFTLFGNLASATAIQELSPALLNVMLRIEVLVVAVLAWVFLGERVEGRFWLGAAMAVAGLVVLQGPISGAADTALVENGTGMALAAAACFSSIAIVTRKFIHRMQPIATNAIRLWFAVALCLLLNGVPNLAAIPDEQFLYAGLASIAGPFLGRIFLMVSARYVEARLTTLANLTTPVMTLVLAYLLLGDWPTAYQMLGGAIMIAGIGVPLIRPARSALEQKTS